MVQQSLYNFLCKAHATNTYIYIYVCVLVDRLVKTWKNLQWNRESKVGGLHTFKIKIIHCSIFTGREREHS